MEQSTILSSLVLCIVLLSCSCKQKENPIKETATATEAAVKKTTMSVKGEWVDIFNGNDLSGWHIFNKKDTNGKWKVSDGVLHFDSKSNAEGGDLVTDKAYENYELMMDWKISECGNSGIFFGVQEDGKLDRTWHSAPEMQVLDNNCHPDAKIITHRAGDLYDLISCSEETVKPAGEWNTVKIRADKGKYQFHLNGVNVVNFEMFTPEWEEMVKESKFNDKEHFGKYRKGLFALQDHGNDVWFRNIKIKEL